MKCRKCGGNRTKAKCNLCEIFATGHTESAQRPAGWPMVSQSMAVHPSQAAEAHAQARALGVPTEFTKRGEPVLTDPSHRLRLAKALGMQDLTERNICRPERD